MRGNRSRLLLAQLVVLVFQFLCLLRGYNRQQTCRYVAPDFEKGVCESHTTKSLKADVGVSTSYVGSGYSYWYECVSVELVRRVILVDLLRMLIFQLLVLCRIV